MIAKACRGLVKLRNGQGGLETLRKCSERFIHRSQVSEYVSRARGSSSPQHLLHSHICCTPLLSTCCIQSWTCHTHVCCESLLHPTILAFVALPHHISFQSHPHDILWYPNWVLQLNPPFFQRMIFGHCQALSFMGSLTGTRGWQSTSTFPLTFSHSLWFYYNLYSCPLVSIQRVCWKSDNCHSWTLYIT